MSKQPFGDAIMHRVCDGDFNEVMRSVNFSCEPRKTVTVGHMSESVGGAVIHPQAVRIQRQSQSVTHS